MELENHAVNSTPTRVVASVDIGKTNMSICVARIRACLPTSSYRVRESAIVPARTVLGDNYPEHEEIRTQFPPMDVEWEGIHYMVRVVRWGVYSLKSTDAQAEMEERTGLRAADPAEPDADDTIEALVPMLMKRAERWLRIWKELGVTDICIEQQVAMGGGGPPGAHFPGSMAANVSAKVLSHVLQCLCAQKPHWNVHFISPRLTNTLVDHIRGEKRQAKGVKKSEKKKMAVEAVSILIERHSPPLSGIFARATRSKKDDLSDCMLQAIRFVRDADGVHLRRQSKPKDRKRSRDVSVAVDKAVLK